MSKVETKVQVAVHRGRVDSFLDFLSQMRLFDCDQCIREFCIMAGHLRSLRASGVSPLLDNQDNQDDREVEEAIGEAIGLCRQAMDLLYRSLYPPDEIIERLKEILSSF